ncbi:MAG TPA: helix-turn-helix domain-containing protein [Blastocatellia bacterium]|nr:helix-turn-helix domain-containing protein [Blastocatellia bacterium]
MPTLGEELKRRREERQIALNDISEATRIGTRFLKAIEADNYGVLPGGIFTRSFIRSFAKQVGMDEDEAIALYQQQTAGGAAEAPPQIESRPKTIIEPSRPVSRPATRRAEPVTYKPTGPQINWTTIVIGGGIAIFIIIIVLALVRQLNRTSPESPSRANSAPANSNTQSNPASNPPPASNGASGSAPPAVAGEPLVVKFEATVDNCSIRYWIDDAQKPSDVTLKKGESQSLPPAQNQVRLSIGNRPAVKMSINNREARFPEGTPNWGAKLTVTRDNLQTYFQ